MGEKHPKNRQSEKTLMNRTESDSDHDMDQEGEGNLLQRFRKSTKLATFVAFIACLLVSLTTATHEGLFPFVFRDFYFFGKNANKHVWNTAALESQKMVNFSEIQYGRSLWNDSIQEPVQLFGNKTSVRKTDLVEPLQLFGNKTVDDLMNNQLGIAFGVFTFTEMVTGILAGVIVDRVGSKTPMIIGMLLQITSLIGYYLSTAFYQFLILLPIDATGTSLSYVSSLSLMAECFPVDADRHKAVSLIHTSISQGFGIGYVTSYLYLLLSGSSKLAYLILCALAVIDGVFRMCMSPPASKAPSDESTNNSNETLKPPTKITECSWSDVATDPYVILCIFLCFAAKTGVAVWPTTVSDWLGFHLKAPVWKITIVFAISFLSVIPVQMIVSRTPKIRYLHISIGFLIVAAGHASLPECVNIWQTIVPLTAMTTGYIPVLSSAISYLTHVSSLRYEPYLGKILGFNHAWTRVGLCIGSLLAGYLVPIITFRWVYRSVAILYFVCSFLALPLRKIESFEKNETSPASYGTIKE